MESKIQKSKDANVFCIAPWVGLNIGPSGRVFPCNFFLQSSETQNLRDFSISEIRSGKLFNDLRKNILDGVPSEGCAGCYHSEKSGNDSSRIYLNNTFHLLHNLVDQTAPDGSLKYDTIHYLDIQLSNLCNFKCRMCGPEFSTSWVKELSETQLGGSPRAIEQKPSSSKYLKYSLQNTIPDFWEKIEKLIPHVERIYFWGGEPLLMPEHYKFLDLLLNHDRKKVRLKYHSNLSKLQCGNSKITEYWKKFEFVQLNASLDAMEGRAEILRDGTNWKQIEENRKKLAEETPHIKFEISCVASAMNIWHIPDFHRSWIEKNFIDVNNFNITSLQNPPFYQSQILPEKFKEQVINKYELHLTYMRQFPNIQDFVLRNFEAALASMKSSNMTSLIPEFLKQTKQLDARRDQSFFAEFPELSFLDVK